LLGLFESWCLDFFVDIRVHPTAFWDGWSDDLKKIFEILFVHTTILESQIKKGNKE